MSRLRVPPGVVDAVAVELTHRKVVSERPHGVNMEVEDFQEEEVEVRVRKGSTMMVQTPTKMELGAPDMDQVSEELRPQEAEDGRKLSIATTINLIYSTNNKYY